MNITIKDWVFVAIILLAGIAYMAMAKDSLPASEQQTSGIALPGF